MPAAIDGGNVCYERRAVIPIGWIRLANNWSLTQVMRVPGGMLVRTQPKDSNAVALTVVKCSPSEMVAWLSTYGVECPSS